MYYIAKSSLQILNIQSNLHTSTLFALVKKNEKTCSIHAVYVIHDLQKHQCSGGALKCRQDEEQSTSGGYISRGWGGYTAFMSLGSRLAAARKVVNVCRTGLMEKPLGNRWQHSGQYVLLTTKVEPGYYNSNIHSFLA